MVPGKLVDKKVAYFYIYVLFLDACFIWNIFLAIMTERRARENYVFHWLLFLLLYSLWELLNAEHSHIAQATVPLLLHCVTLPCGTDTFWRLVQEEFHNSDWRVRFVAGNRAHNLEQIDLCHFFIINVVNNFINNKLYIFFFFSSFQLSVLH